LLKISFSVFKTKILTNNPKGTTLLQKKKKKKQFSDSTHIILFKQKTKNTPQNTLANRAMPFVLCEGGILDKSKVD
jgi:hypothetical protein